MTEIKMPTRNGVIGRQKNLKTFTVDFVDLDGTKYQGKFTTKRLSIADIVHLGVRKSELNGGMYYDPASPGKGVDASTDELSAIIAHLELVLQVYPSWWDLSKINNVELLNAVYKEVADFEESFLRQQGQPSTAGSGPTQNNEGNSGGDLQGADYRGVPSNVVDGEVQASLKP